MTQALLLPETSVREAGAGPGLHLGEAESGRWTVTVDVTRVTERESLELYIWGSSDGDDWGLRPMVKLPRVFYCGRYQTVLDLPDRSTKYLKAEWHVNRWTVGDVKPLFTMTVFVQASKPAALTAIA
ncbi:MAG TPA: hypothetical protein VLY04_10620 [Bryobacteraceae bacterium]|nr:hypothetical protein [Bryobacteraceae bacterium]